jgi:hypothetical protein
MLSTTKIKFGQPVTPMGIVLPRALSMPIDGRRVIDGLNRSRETGADLTPDKKGDFSF